MDDQSRDEIAENVRMTFVTGGRQTFKSCSREPNSEGSISTSVDINIIQGGPKVS